MSRPSLRNSSVLSAGLLAIAVAGASADVPRLIHYQGKLMTSSGTALVGPVDLQLRLYDHPTNTSPILYDETHTGVPLNNGLFSIQIGSQGGGVPDAAVDQAEVYLGVSVNGASELTPRTRLISGPYNMRSLKSNSAEQLVRVGTLTPEVTVDASGNVGVGTGSPQGKLDVNGTLAISGDKGVAGQVLTSQGPSSAPAWTTPGTGLEVKQLIRRFDVAAGANILMGDVVSFVGGFVSKGFGLPFGGEAIFNNASTNYPAVTSLDASKFVVAYYDTGSSDGRAVVGSVTGNTITYGSPVTFDGSMYNGYGPTISTLDATHFVIAYSNYQQSGNAVVGEVSGTSITLGSNSQFNTGTGPYAYYPSVAALDSSRFVVAFHDESQSRWGRAVIGSVSGTSISSYGSESTFNSSTSGIRYTSVAALGANKFVVAYQDPQYYFGNTYRGMAVVGTASGNSISSWGSINTFEYGGSGHTAWNIAAASLPGTENFVIVYKEQQVSPNVARAIVGTVSGTNIQFGTPLDYKTGSSGAWAGVTGISASKFAVGYQTYDTSSKGVGWIGNVSGTTIEKGAEYQFNAGNTDYINLATMTGGGQLVFSYQDSANSNRGTAVIADQLSGSNIIGVAQQAGGAGASIPVVIAGVADTPNGLTVGAVYYADTNGTLTTTPTYNRVGVAVSTNEILLGGNQDNPNQFFGG